MGKQVSLIVFINLFDGHEKVFSLVLYSWTKSTLTTQWDYSINIYIFMPHLQIHLWEEICKYYFITIYFIIYLF